MQSAYIQLHIKLGKEEDFEVIRLTVTVNNTKDTKICDSRSNITLINSKINKNVKHMTQKYVQTFGIISRVQQN